MDQQHKYWLGRWERGETGWHQDEVEPELIAGFKDVAPTRVLVPLCGKSLDLLWLASQGHTVIGVELSEPACRDFFREHGLTPKLTEKNHFKIFSAENITLYCGDFFKFSSSDLGTVGAVYDRAALIALPPDLRAIYVTHLTSILEECADPKHLHFLQIILQREDHDLDGPPFSILKNELIEYYGKKFDVRLIKKEPVEMGSSNKKSIQSVFLLTWRR